MTKLTLIVTPAYGRDYTKEADVQTAWDEDKDFIIQSPGMRGKYLNKSDAENHGLKSVIIRYANAQELLEVEV